MSSKLCEIMFTWEHLKAWRELYRVYGKNTKGRRVIRNNELRAARKGK